EDGIRDLTVTGVQTCALPISAPREARGKVSPARRSRAQGDGRGVHEVTLTIPAFGKPRTRVDGRAKVTGEALYPSDMPLANPARSEERRVGKERGCREARCGV